MTTTQAAAKLPRPAGKTVALGLLFVGLAAIVAFAGWREAHKVTPAAAPADSHAFGEARPAHSAAEERFAQALWAIHSDVRTAAVRMTFAGLTYKMGDADRASVQTKVAPLTAVFAQAEQQLRALEVPASMRELTQNYAGALARYREASLEMVKVVQDGNDAHLLKAQALSEQASGVLLEVGEHLWPGEVKPN